jgi:hypothetical protein
MEIRIGASRRTCDIGDRYAFIERDLKVSRLTTTKYLDALAEHGLLQKQKIGRTNYYINIALNRILIGAETGSGNV